MKLIVMQRKDLTITRNNIREMGTYTHNPSSAQAGGESNGMIISKEIMTDDYETETKATCEFYGYW